MISHDDPLIRIFDHNGVEVCSFPAARADWKQTAEKRLDIGIPDSEFIHEAWRGSTLIWDEIKDTTDLSDCQENMVAIFLRNPEDAAKARQPIITSRDVFDELKKAGLVLDNVRRCVIDLQAGRPALLYFDCFADERILAAFRPSSEIDVTVPEEVTTHEETKEV